MSTSKSRMTANRANALSSTGPVTEAGKAVASTNATRHGLLSQRMLLDDEDPGEFADLCLELQASLRPVNTIELGLVEKIAITMWRQRRLMRAEAAQLNLDRTPDHVARTLARRCDEWDRKRVKVEDLVPFDRQRLDFCERTKREIEALEQINLTALKDKAPLVFGQLKSDAEDQGGPEAFLADYQGGLTAYVGELHRWCTSELATAAERPYVLKLAEQAKARNLVLPPKMLDLFARYQTALDNQLYKALRALRETQEWRLKTLEHEEATEPERHSVGETI